MDSTVLLTIGFDTVHPLDKEFVGLGDHTFDLDAPCLTSMRHLEAHCVTVIARTPTDLRRAVPMGELLPASPALHVILCAVPRWRPPLLPWPSDEAAWRLLEEFSLRRIDGGGWQVSASFAAPAPAGMLVAAVSRAAASGRPADLGTPIVALIGPGASAWRSGDPNSRVVIDGADPGPCEVMLAVAGAQTPATTGHRVPAAVAAPPAVPPPVDERSVNPIGFARSPTLPFALLSWSGEHLEIARGGETVTRVPASGALTEVEIESLRPYAGVCVPPSAELRVDGPVLARTLLSLAAAGVPLVPKPGEQLNAAFGNALAGLVQDVTESSLADEIDREAYSVRLRRTALSEFSTASFWRKVTVDAGLLTVPYPRVSVVLPTRRPEMVSFALSQIARQQGVSVEVILALHGVAQDDQRVVRAVRHFSPPIQVMEVESAAPFGVLLNRAVVRASGSLLIKMDDDDWYGPHFLFDLLLANRYSGAELTGCFAEFVYLQGPDVTVRRARLTESYSADLRTGLIAGGSLLISRDVLESVGGFKDIPMEDVQLVASVRAAGGRVYRSHGLNYLYRRGRASSHTWQIEPEFFLRGDVRKWEGLYLNPLMADLALERED